MSEPAAAESRDTNKISRLTWAGFGVAIILLVLFVASQVSVREQTKYRLAQAEQQAAAVEGVELWVTWPTHLLIGDEGRVAVDVVGDVGWQQPFTLTVTLPSGIGNADRARVVEWGVGRENGRYQQFTLPLQNTALYDLQTTQTITIHTTLDHTLEPLAVTLESTNQAANREFWAGVVSQNGALLLVIAAVVSIASLVFQEQGRTRQLRLEEIKLAQQQETREYERQQAANKERQQQLEQQERQMRQKTAEQVIQLRAFLSNADKISLQRLWPTIDPTLLQDTENHDWLTALIDFSLRGQTPDAKTFGEIAQVWTAEAAGAFLCAGIEDKALFDCIPLEKVTNPTLRNRLIQTQRGRLPLQDWPPDIPLPPDAIARSPLGNTPLFLTLRKDPLLHSRTEDELSSLFGLGAFWIEHPLYARIATATQSQIVCGGRGNGRTALARALCYYEPQYQRYYWAYLPIFAVQSTMEYDVRSGLAEQLLQYVLSKPTLLSMLPEAGRSLLGQLLAQALSPTYVLAKVEQALSQGRWFRQADSAQQDIWRMVGKTHLEMLAQCLHDEVRLPMTQWARACLECFVTLGFRGLRLVLDVAGASPEAYAALKVELNAWQQAGVAATIFLPDNGLVTWQQNDIGRQTLALDWSEEQLGALLAHRFRKLSRRDPEAVFTEKAERDFLKAVKTPREMADLWYAILHSVDSWPKNALILPEHVARGVAQLQPSVQKKPEVTLITDDEQVGLIGQQPNPQKIHEVIGLMRGSFSLEEIRGLCASLGVDYEELGGENIRSAKVRELVDYMVRRNRFPDLLEMLTRERPSTPW